MSKSGKSRAGSVCLIIGALLLLSCVGWYLHNSRESQKAGEISYQKLVAVKEYVDNNTEVSSVTEENETVAEETEVLEEMPIVNIDGCPYIGYLAIPSQELEMAVADTWDDEILKSSLCRYFGSTVTNDIVIAGHNYSTTFGKLKNLVVGDEVYFTNMNGEVILYEVSDIEVLKGTDITAMTENEFDLTLYTCTVGGKDRLTIRCLRK